MALSMFKVYHRYYISCIFILLFINIPIFFYFLRYQTKNGLIQDSDAIDKLRRRLSVLINSSEKELEKHQDLIQRYLDKINSIEQHISTQKKASVNDDHPKTIQPKIKTKSTLFCDSDVSIPILVMTCNRPTGLERTLLQLIQRRHESRQYIHKAQFPIYVSQGCNDKSTMNMVLKYKNELEETLDYKQSADKVTKGLVNKRLAGYFKISDHYKIAMNWIFNTDFYKTNGTHKLTTAPKPENMQIYKLRQSNTSSPGPLPISNSKIANYDSVIIVEDDLDISPDFFHYFLSSYKLLKNDNSLYCVSAWNDNGKNNLVDNTAYSAIYRTDFFPGLGWMLLRSLWYEIGPTWPNSFWDEYLRENKIRKGRQCIRPELPRTFTFGRKGVSNGQFYDKHLRYLMLNKKMFDFCNNKPNSQIYFYDKTNVSTHSSKTTVLQFPPDINATLKQYNEDWLYLVYTYSKLLTVDELMKMNKNIVNSSNTFFNEEKNIKMIPSPLFVRIEYRKNKELIAILKSLTLMDDLKNGVARTAYQKILTCYYSNYRVFIAPSLQMPASKRVTIKRNLKSTNKHNMKNQNKFFNISSPFLLIYSGATTKKRDKRINLNNNKIIKKT